MTHVENCADVFALAAVDARARGQTLNVVDGPGERIWTYLSDYMRGSGQPGWRLPVPYWLAIWMVRLAFATVFRRPPRCPASSSRAGSSRGSSRSASRTAGCGKHWAGPRHSTTSSAWCGPTVRRRPQPVVWERCSRAALAGQAAGRQTEGYSIAEEAEGRRR